MIRETLKKSKLLQKLYYIYRRIISKKKYQKQYTQFKQNLSQKRGFQMESKDVRMVLNEDTSSTLFDTHYIYHPAWAVRIVKKINPEVHVDISSTLTFSSMLSAFIPVEFYDYRPANLQLSGLISKKGDLQNLPFKDGSVASLSCLHTVEHIGLGRYGDPIDPNGDLVAVSELNRVLAPNGNLLFAVPIGQPRICFNAHRIYSYTQIMEYFSELTLEEFSLIPDNAIETGIIANASKKDSDAQEYGCGLFWFSKKS